jgi:hypothetical protein
MKRNLTGMVECGNTYKAEDGETRKCTRQYGTIALLKIMQVTECWDANDQKTVERSREY